jgi:hypothetical protein
VPANQILSYHGQELTDPKKTLEQYGVIQDGILLLKRSPSSMVSDNMEFALEYIPESFDRVRLLKNLFS